MPVAPSPHPCGDTEKSAGIARCPLGGEIAPCSKPQLKPALDLYTHGSASPRSWFKMQKFRAVSRTTDGNRQFIKITQVIRRLESADIVLHPLPCPFCKHTTRPSTVLRDNVVSCDEPELCHQTNPGSKEESSPWVSGSIYVLIWEKKISCFCFYNMKTF